MAEVVWAESALSELDTIADYIALRDDRAARDLVRRVVDHVGQLAEHPASGPVLAGFEDLRYRQIIELPCRVIYRNDGDRVHVVHVVRVERLLDLERPKPRDA